LKCFLKKASKYFVCANRLWWCEDSGHHWIMLFRPDCLEVIVEAHDRTGHKSIYVTWGGISEKFWWPTFKDNVKWFKNTCHECQTMSMEKILLPPTISMPATLFSKCHINTMQLPVSGSYKYII
jgi:hypothetical protein